MKRVVLVAALVACRPDLGERDSLVTSTRVLAVRGDPPEAAPGASVHYDLLVAGPAGVLPTPHARWAFCSTPKLLTENGAVSAACLEGTLPTLADGTPSVDAPVPAEACSTFGPKVTSAEVRPRDPDVTGGFFQPVRVTVEDGVAFGLERVTCNLANASVDVARDFTARYVANRNPVLLPLEAPASVPRGGRIVLRASWPADSAEPYVVYDLPTRAVVDHRESMRVSWFATAGSFDADRTGRTETERETSSENAWTAPDRAGAVHVFVVLRDARGGIAFTTADIAVE